MAKEYTVTYKVAPALAEYVYQEDKADHKAGDLHKSPGGHMWYSVSDGSTSESYGFVSQNDRVLDSGRLAHDDDAGYQQTAYEVTVKLSEAQYERLIAFSSNPSSFGFDVSNYNLLQNSCVDFVYASLQSIGYNQDKFEGDLWPGNNKDNVKGLLYGFGAQIVRDDLTRHGAYYDTGAGQSCMWLSPADSVNASPVKNEFALTTDTLSGIKYKESIDHDAAAAQVSNGLVTSGGGWNLSYDPNKLNLNQYQGNWVNNTFTAAATQILADGYRPGNINTVKDVFDFSLRNSSQSLTYGSTLAALLNSGDARARLTLPTDPLVLDLNGDGVRLTDYLTAPYSSTPITMAAALKKPVGSATRTVSLSWMPMQTARSTISVKPSPSTSAGLPALTVKRGKNVSPMVLQRLPVWTAMPMAYSTNRTPRGRASRCG